MPEEKLRLFEISMSRRFDDNEKEKIFIIAESIECAIGALADSNLGRVCAAREVSRAVGLVIGEISVELTGTSSWAKELRKSLPQTP